MHVRILALPCSHLYLVLKGYSRDLPTSGQEQFLQAYTNNRNNTTTKD